MQRDASKRTISAQCREILAANRTSVPTAINTQDSAVTIGSKHTEILKTKGDHWSLSGNTELASHIDNSKTLLGSGIALGNLHGIANTSTMSVDLVEHSTINHIFYLDDIPLKEAYKYRKRTPSFCLHIQTYKKGNILG